MTPETVPPVRPQPLLVVRDVPASGRWYASLLDGRLGHGGDEYEQLLVGDGLVLQLHHRDVDHHHGPLLEPDVAVGNGVVVWFAVAAFHGAVARARELGAEIVTDVHVNPNSGRHELWLRDPDGYLVVIAEGADD